MPVLSNPRWERFATLLAKGVAISQAYRDAGYTGGKGIELAGNPAVVARIAELEARSSGKAVSGQTLERLINELDEMYDNAQRLGQPAAGVQATMAKAKLLGLVVDKAEVATTLRKPLRESGAYKPMTLAEWQEKFQPRTVPAK